MGASAKVKSATLKTKPKGSLITHFFDIAKGVQVMSKQLLEGPA